VALLGSFDLQESVHSVKARRSQGLAKPFNSVPMRITPRFLTVLAFIPSFAIAVGAVSLYDAGRSWGRFVGTVKTEWHEDGRTMHLLDNFGYVDGAGNVWTAPKGHKIDGASIPQVFWSFIGGPLRASTGTLQSSTISSVMYEKDRGGLFIGCFTPHAGVGVSNKQKRK
jgi:uncharacterized protein DUF1353